MAIGNLRPGLWRDEASEGVDALTLFLPRAFGRYPGLIVDMSVGSRWCNAALIWFFRIAASGAVPARWFERRLPSVVQRSAKTGRIVLEIVVHCWSYSHFLVYQLSSLVVFPPTRLSVTVTVFYCPEDRQTASLLAFFETLQVPGVRWNWQALPKKPLFRRAIGRNKAALATQADWVWFTDCDLLFREGCLDVLADRLQGRRDALVYPRQERRTPLLASDHPLLVAGRREPRLLDVDTAQFTAHHPSRATGPLQIVHGDVCRACGYCDAIAAYQKPSDRWCKAHEDRAFRWLLRSRGLPIDIPGVYRIRHIHKGRYSGGEVSTELRSRIRRAQSWLRHRRQR